MQGKEQNEMKKDIQQHEEIEKNEDYKNVISDIQNISLKKLKNNSYKFTILDSLVCLIQKDDQNTRIIKTNLFLLENLIFQQNKYHYFVENNFEQENIISALKSETNNPSKWNCYNQIISNMLKDQLSQKISENVNMEQHEIISIVKKSYEAILSVLKLLKERILLRQVTFINLKKNSSLEFHLPIARIPFCTAKFNIKFISDSKIDIDCKFFMNEKNEFLFTKEINVYETRFLKDIVTINTSKNNSIGKIIDKLITRVNQIKLSSGKPRKKSNSKKKSNSIRN